MTTRRELLLGMAGAAGLMALDPRLARAREAALITRAIPSTGERLPIVGLGARPPGRSRAATNHRARAEANGRLGGTVFDTAPSYGASEEVAGRLAQELGIAKKLFWATKLNVAPRGGGSADPSGAATRNVLPAIVAIDLIRSNMADLHAASLCGSTRTRAASATSG
jgi:hypothetical protein